MKYTLTPKQLAAYNGIRGYIKDKGYAPSVSEIAKMIGAKYNTSGKRVVDELETKGYITRLAGKARSITIVTDDHKEIKRLREIRDAANTFVRNQNLLRKYYADDQKGPDTLAASAKVAESFLKLQRMVSD